MNWFIFFGVFVCASVSEGAWRCSYCRRMNPDPGLSPDKSTSVQAETESSTQVDSGLPPSSSTSQQTITESATQTVETSLNSDYGTPELLQGYDCLPDTEWNSWCNHCKCSAEGRPECTKNSCPEKQGEPDLQCAPGTYWRLDCNVCSCSPNGRSECTRMLCNGTPVLDFNPNRKLKPITPEIQGIDNEDLKDIQEVRKNIVKRSPTLCYPNTRFKIDCNICDCDDEGDSYSCTVNECLEDNTKDDINKDVEVFKTKSEDAIETHELCKPRGTFYISCNVCHCNADGTNYSCSNKPCPLPADVELFHELRSLRSAFANDTKKIVCPANKMFIKDCNTCRCNEDGTNYVCTRKVCINNPDTDVKKTKNTFRFSSARRKRATTQTTPKNCQPGQEFRLDCNMCLCDNEGSAFSCTRNDCSATNNYNGGTRTKREVAPKKTQECEPGSVFDQGCNVCRCSEDGKHATCTTKLCKGDGKDNEIVSKGDPGFRCNPGEQFKRDCNDCTCSADGKSVFCTLRLCEQDLAPAI